MAPVSFGIFDHLDRREAPLSQIYEERLQLLEVADAAGFYSYHLAEHHQTPLSMVPSPGIFLAAAAQRTRRLRLGPLVYLLPMYNPLRLIEEICMLDHLSGGRLDLGVGRGISPYELGYFGVDPARSREMFHEALAVLREGLVGDRLTHGGAHYHFQDVPMELRPLQRPYPPLWYPTSNRDSVPYIASHGMNAVVGGTPAAVRPQVELYWETWNAHRDDPNRLNGHVAEPKVGVHYKLHLAETDDEALAIARPAHRQHHDSLVKLWHDFGSEPVGSFTPDLDEMIAHKAALIGSPARIREQIAEFFEVTGCNYLIVSIHWGGMTHEQALRSLRLFVDEVMPAFTPVPESQPVS
jgi:alkanesulfonate monooxygenase SsuD/methylene tetrahydromethanopterin reductase-like flavin-dependent oxidoreductase (luciferase family)